MCWRRMPLDLNVSDTYSKYTYTHYTLETKLDLVTKNDYGIAFMIVCAWKTAINASHIVFTRKLTVTLNRSRCFFCFSECFISSSSTLFQRLEFFRSFWFCLFRGGKWKVLNLYRNYSKNVWAMVKPNVYQLFRRSQSQSRK